MNLGSGQKLAIDSHGLLTYLRTLFVDCVVKSVNDLCELVGNGTCVEIDMIKVESQNAHSSQLEEILQGENIFFLSRGFAELQYCVKKGSRQSQGNQHGQESRVEDDERPRIEVVKRELQLKQRSYFTLINYENLRSEEPVRHLLMAKTSCKIGVIPLRKQFHYSMLRKLRMKVSLLGRIFDCREAHFEAEKSQLRFKQFLREFQHENCRKDARLIKQGSINSRLIIIAKGEIKISKTFYYRYNSKQNQKQIDILRMGVGSILGGEIFLAGSRTIKQILKGHSLMPSSSHQVKKTNQSEEEIKKPQSQSDQEKHYTLYSPNDNISNFSIFVSSANVEVYSISMSRVQAILSDRWRANMVATYERQYIALLNRAEYKLQIMQQQMLYEHIRSRSEIATVSARVMLGHSDTGGEVRQGNCFQIKKSQLDNVSSKEYQSMKDTAVMNLWSGKLQRRVNIMLRDVERGDSEDYKKKIEGLLKEKLIGSKAVSANGEQEDANKLKAGLRKRITEDLQQIFLKNMQNNPGNLARQSQLLDKRVSQLNRRYLNQQSRLVIHKQEYDQKQNKLYRISLIRNGVLPCSARSNGQNYLNGVDMEQYTSRKKELYLNKIYRTNKIKEQFMKISSECKPCNCYNDFEEKYMEGKIDTGSNGLANASFKRIRTGTQWKMRQVNPEQQPLEVLYNQKRFLSQRSQQKYNHNAHLLQLGKNREMLERKLSMPQL